MRSPRSSFAVGVLVGLLAGGLIAWGAFGLRAHRQRAELAARVSTLEADAAQLQAERERLHHELGEIVQERREMASTAEHLRGQVEQQLQRLEALAKELGPPADHGDGSP